MTVRWRVLSMMSSTPVVLRPAPAPSPAAGRMMSMQVSIMYRHEYTFYTEMVLIPESGLGCGIFNTVAVIFENRPTFPLTWHRLYGVRLGIGTISVKKGSISLCSWSQHNVFPFFLPPLVLIIPFSSCSAAPFDECSREEDKTWKWWCAVSLPWLEYILHTLTHVHK